VEFVEVEPGRYEIMAATRFITGLKSMFGKRTRQPVSVEEMNRVIAQRSASAMIGLDTNVIVRYIMQHDVRESARATRFVESLTQACRNRALARPSTS